MVKLHFLKSKRMRNTKFRLVNTSIATSSQKQTIFSNEFERNLPKGLLTKVGTVCRKQVSALPHWPMPTEVRRQRNIWGHMEPRCRGQVVLQRSEHRGLSLATTSFQPGLFQWAEERGWNRPPFCSLYICFISGCLPGPLSKALFPLPPHHTESHVVPSSLLVFSFKWYLLSQACPDHLI